MIPVTGIWFHLPCQTPHPEMEQGPSILLDGPECKKIALIVYFAQMKKFAVRKSFSFSASTQLSLQSQMKKVQTKCMKDGIIGLPDEEHKK